MAAMNAPHEAASVSLAQAVGVARLELLNAGGWANGDVYLGELDGEPVVVKSYHNKPASIRAIGRYLLARERRAYRALAEVEGVPELRSSGDRESLVLSYVAGQRINRRLLRPGAEGVIQSLKSLVAALHERGVFHMDLRNSGNILVNGEDRAVVIDFASAVILQRSSRFSSLMRRLCRRFDDYAVAKWEALSKR